MFKQGKLLAFLIALVLTFAMADLIGYNRLGNNVFNHVKLRRPSNSVEANPYWAQIERYLGAKVTFNVRMANALRHSGLVAKFRRNKQF